MPEDGGGRKGGEVGRRVIGDSGGRLGTAVGRSGAGQAENVQCLGMMFGKMWDLVKLGGWSEWGLDLGWCRSARLLKSEGAPKEPA